MEVIVAIQWEYCAILSVTTGYDDWLIGNPKYKPSERNYQTSVQSLSLDVMTRTRFKGNDTNSLSEIVCDLGLNGWELGSVDQGIMYFNRPK